MAPNAEQSQDRQPKARIFISYSRKDMAFADRLDAALKARGFDPLIDRTEIYVFEDWWQRIQNLIIRADTVIFVLSPDSVSSDTCHKEVRFAASRNKRFAPIQFRQVDTKMVPSALERLDFEFFDDAEKFEQNVDRLVEARRVANHPRECVARNKRQRALHQTKQPPPPLYHEEPGHRDRARQEPERHDAPHLPDRWVTEQ